MKCVMQMVILGSAIAAGALVGYKVATNVELRTRIIQGAKDACRETQKKVDVVSEEVALHTAKMTKNPKVNQEWVDKQWEAIGF